MIFKMLFRFIMLTLLSLLGLKASLAQVTNGDFEQVNENNKAIGWNFSNSDSANNFLAISKESPYAGNYSLKMVKKQERAMLIANTTVHIETDKTAKLRVKAMVKSSAEKIISNFYMQLFDGQKKRIGGEDGVIDLDPAKKGQWQEVDFSLMISPEVKRGVLFISLGNHDLEIDNITSEWVTGPADKQITAFADEVVKLLKTNSIVSDSVNWEEVNKNLPAALVGTQYGKDDAFIVNYLLSYLRKEKDIHSFYYSPSDYKNLNAYAGKQGQGPIKTVYPTGKLLEDNVAYVVVPAFSSYNAEGIQEYADSLNAIIMNLQSKNPKGWIVDLSMNHGGNMYPMIAGLNALIPEGKVMSFVRKDGESSVYLKGGTFGNVKLTKVPKKEKDKKIAVFTSTRTASSGEMTSIALMNNPLAKSFGIQTAGLNSANATFPLSNGGAIALASALVKDPKNRVYLGPIEPTEKAHAKSFDDLIRDAKAWILEDK